MSEREMIRRGDAALEWVHRWPEAPAVGATVIVQAHEQAVFVADGVPMGTVGPGRYALDPAQWPAVAAFVDAAGEALRIEVYFVTTSGPWWLDLDARVGALPGSGAGRAGQLRASARVALRVADAVAVVRAVLLDPGGFAARHAAWCRDAGRLVADTVHGMMLQGSLAPSRAASSGFAVSRHVLPALRGRLAPDGLDVLELERFALAESTGAPTPEPTMLRIEASVLARALAAAPPTLRPQTAAPMLKPVVVTAPARVGVLRAGVVTPSHDPMGVRHDQGVPVIAMDARAFPRWRGAEASDHWALRLQAAPELGAAPWPVDASTIAGEEAAREAYRRCRQHLLSVAPELSARDTRGPDEALLAPALAWSEAFTRDGVEVARLSVDRTTDALALAGSVALTAAVPLADGLRGVAWRPGDAALQLAIVTSAMGEPDGVALAAGLPSGQTFVDDLPGRWELRAESVTESVDVPSGWLVLAWARCSGRCVEALAAEHGDDGWMAAFAPGGVAAATLPTGLESQAGAAVAWLLRVRPGVWRVTHHQGRLGDGRLQCLSLAHTASEGWQPAATLHEHAPRDSVPEAALRDREVFPGQRVSRVSDYVRMVRGLRADQASRKQALSDLGIELSDFGEVMQRWSRAMIDDHALGREVARAMSGD
jgi:hypothetical protein